MQAGVYEGSADFHAGVAADANVSLDEAKAGAKSYADFPTRRPWQPEPGQTAEKFAKDLDTYLEKANGVKDPSTRAYAISNYMGDQTPQAILDRAPNFRERPTELIHEPAAHVPEPHVANPHAPDPAPVRFGADPDAPTVNPDHPAAVAEHSPAEPAPVRFGADPNAPTVNPDHPAALAEHTPAEPAAPRGPAVDPNAHSIHPENPGAPHEAVIDTSPRGISPENPGAPREAVIDSKAHSISPENPGAPREAVIDTGPRGISPENPGAPADHPTVLEPRRPADPNAPTIDPVNPGAPREAVINTSTSEHGISPENPGAPAEAVIERKARPPVPEANAGAAKSTPPEAPHVDPETPTRTFEPHAGAEKPPAPDFPPAGTPAKPTPSEGSTTKPGAPSAERPAGPVTPKYADEAAAFPKKEFPADGKINPDTVYTTLPTDKVPDKPFYYQLEDGKTVLLDKKLGGGANSQAYTLGGAGNENLVIKFSPNDPQKGVERLAQELMQKDANLTHAEAVSEVNNFHRSEIPAAAEKASRDIVTSAEKASKNLASAGIEQAKVYSTGSSTKVPYQINERVVDAEMFKYPPKGEKPVGTGSATWTPAHDKAVVNLYQKLADSNLVAEDLHVENIYFKKQGDGSYVAGILDHDNILPWNEAQQAPWFKQLKDAPAENGIRSMATTEQGFGSPTEFMAKMLEHKRWIEQPSLFTPGMQGKMMNMDAIKGSTFEKYITPVAPKPVKPTGWMPVPPPRRSQLIPWPGVRALAA
jgi:hypothetical protein